MSDAFPLPPRPNVEEYDRLAHELQTACQSGESGATGAWAKRLAENVARLSGIEVTAEVRRYIEIEAAKTERRWQKFQAANDGAERCTVADARSFLARAHGFASWREFDSHLEGLAHADSPTSIFEAAADAVIAGYTAALRKLLAENPGLARARSTREHRSTLLHYVSANGVEDFRQRTPENIVEIATLLLDAGADVNAESEAYGGRSTTLGLTATSCHPEAAGVQLALMDALIARGAVIDGPDGGSAVNGCLHNGRGEAARFLADRGGRLDLEGAAGVGRFDVVKSFFTSDGSLTAAATRQQMQDGFAWACEFGRTAVVDFLLQRGIELDARLKHNGQTGLHWAAYGGHADTVKLLVERGAPIDATDESFGGTPLEWAIYEWGNSPYAAERGRYYEVVAMLARAGAHLSPEWPGDDEERQRAYAKMRSDPRMMAALGGG